MSCNVQIRAIYCDAVSGIDVNFTLVGPSGSELEPATGMTDDSGSVSTTVTAGKVSGSVRVQIATSDGGIKNISDILLQKLQYISQPISPIRCIL